MMSDVNKDVLQESNETTVDPVDGVDPTDVENAPDVQATDDAIDPLAVLKGLGVVALEKGIEVTAHVRTNPQVASALVTAQQKTDEFKAYAGDMLDKADTKAVDLTADAIIKGTEVGQTTAQQVKDKANRFMARVAANIDAKDKAQKEATAAAERKARNQKGGWRSWFS